MPQEIQTRLIEEEMKQAYMDYAMSVIVARAIPDVRDGLKPVHRRILYAMEKLGLEHNKSHKKCARIVGDVLGKFHPHGDAAVYDALVRMAQDFSLRYLLVDGHGNFGNIDGDNAASMRYTEARLQKLSEDMLVDIEKNTVNFVPNYDSSTEEPVVLPSKIPNILLNGSSGIAVGMATNIPPHNMKEICSAIMYYITNKDCSIHDLMHFIKGPDFPTGAQILGEQGIHQAYQTGRGKIIVRAKTEIEPGKIAVTEIPYMVNKSMLIENIAELVRNKRIEGVHDIRDESDRKGMRIVFELKKGVNPDILLNQLYSMSNLQTTFGIIMLALVRGEPKVLNLKSIIEEFVKHRFEVITRRTKFDLEKSEKQAHILEGLEIAIQNIDQIVQGIKKSENTETAKQFLTKNFQLTETQALAILDMRLHRLTSLETSKIKKEYESLINLIKDLKEILADENKVYEIIKTETIEVMEKYGDERKTEIIKHGEQVITNEDLIDEEDIVITLTNAGYIKQIPLETYKSQKRGGTGIRAATTKEDDVIGELFMTSNLNHLLFFTNKGKIHWLKAYQVPEASRYAKGVNVVNLLHLDKDEKISAVLPMKSLDQDMNLIFTTKNGLVKKTHLEEFSNPRKGGIQAILLKENDEVVQVRLSTGDMSFIIGSKNGRAVKFNEKDVRVMGRTSQGVRGIKLHNDLVVGMEAAREDEDILTVTENGFGKRTSMSEYRLINRGGKGVRNIKVTEKNGPVIDVKAVKDSDEIMCITDKGQIIRMQVKEISRIGRNTQGVRVIRLREGDKVAKVCKVVESE